MQSKKICCFFTILLLLCELSVLASASTTSLSFRADGVTIHLTFPEEFHPNTTITHNITITAHANLTLESFTLFIYAPVNATFQEIKNRTITWDFLENETLTSRIEFQLPENTKGMLYCEMTLQTDLGSDYSAYSIYTTRVSELTFSEMQDLYYEMLSNYTMLQADYEALLNEYDHLLANYSSIFLNYSTLLSQNAELLDNYNAKVSAYDSLLDYFNQLSNEHNALKNEHRSKLDEYNAFQIDYDELNSTHYELRGNYSTLQALYNDAKEAYAEVKIELASLEEQITFSDNVLNTNRFVMVVFIVAVACLVAFIIYIKRKKPEPYVVIRKETVSMKTEEET